MFDVSAKAGWTNWVEFCLQGTYEEANATIKRCDELRIIKDDYMKRIAEVDRNVRVTKIVEDLFCWPIVKVSALQQRLGVTYPTAKADIEKLVEAGLLAELPDTFPRTLYAPEIWRIAYGDID